MNFIAMTEKDNIEAIVKNEETQAIIIENSKGFPRKIGAPLFWQQDAHTYISGTQLKYKTNESKEETVTVQIGKEYSNVTHYSQK